MRSEPRLRVLASRTALVACLAVVLVACGDDDDPSTSETTETTESTDDTTETTEAGGDLASAACESIVEFNAAVTDVDTEGASEDELIAMGEELSGVWEPVAAGAPDDVADQVAEITSSLDDLAAGDPVAFDSDATFETYTAVLGAIVGECGFETLSVTAADFSFAGLPETVPSGTVAVELENTSEAELHEIVIFKKADGETRNAMEILSDPAAEEAGPGEFAGAAFAPPGVTSTGLAELTPGSYIAVCFIPVGSGEDGPPHFTEGMVGEFSVE